MSLENAKKFEELLRTDEALQAKLKDAVEAYAGDKGDDHAIFDGIIAPLAEAAGFAYTYDEAVELARSGAELDDEALDAVAGGDGFCLIVGGGGDADYCWGGNQTGLGACKYIGAGFHLW